MVFEISNPLACPPCIYSAFNHGLWNFKSFTLPSTRFNYGLWNFKSFSLPSLGCLKFQVPCFPCCCRKFLLLLVCGARRSYLWKITKWRLTFMLVDFLSPFCLILERSFWKKRTKFYTSFLLYLQMYWSLFHNRPLSGS